MLTLVVNFITDLVGGNEAHGSAAEGEQGMVGEAREVVRWEAPLKALAT